ncbi:MAG: hypothetical protein GF411_06655 [Candidatus Lokiarchaeota archaeon]|nr:hypothetical protein [Candidatus Lokiarchaeota archaeon]
MTKEEINDISVEISSGTLYIRIMDLENGMLILLSDSLKFRLGVSVIAMPGTDVHRRPLSRGIFAYDGNTSLLRSLSEQIARLSGRSCMLVSSVKELDQAKLIEIMAVFKGILLS